VGTRIFLGGAQGFVAWNGTQHNPARERAENGVPVGGAGTLSLIGDLKAMSVDFLKAAVFKNYGVSMFVGVGIPIPVLDEEMARFVTVRDREIRTMLFDYGVPGRSRPTLRTVDYAELRSGFVELNGRKVRTAPLSSLHKARVIAATLKEWIARGEFYLQEPAAPLPADAAVKAFEVKELD
jgi:uncharacterized protein (DUF39 family)